MGSRSGATRLENSVGRTYREDSKFEERNMPKAILVMQRILNGQAVLAPHHQIAFISSSVISGKCIRRASSLLDMKGASDLVTEDGAERFAVRFRKAEWWRGKVGESGHVRVTRHDVTFREHRDSGTRTELDKFISLPITGLFYGFLNEDESEFLGYWLVSGGVFRDCWKRYCDGELYLETKFRSNNDGTYLRSFNLLTFPDGILLASKENLFWCGGDVGYPGHILKMHADDQTLS